MFDVLWLDGQDLTARRCRNGADSLDEVVAEGKGMRLHVLVAERRASRSRGAKERGFEGIDREAARQPVPAGQALAGLAEDQDPEPARCVDPGMDARARGAAGLVRRAARSARTDGELRWVGQVGTGFTDQMLAYLMAAERRW